MTSKDSFIATHWGVYQYKEGEKILSPFKGDSFPAQFGQDYPQDNFAPTRILKPAIRKSYLDYGPQDKKGRRGNDEFVEVDMDKALDLVSDEIKRIKQRYGNGAIYSGSYGWSSAGRFHHAQSQLKRFFNCIGGSVRSHQTYSYAAAETLLPHIIGGLNGLVTNHTLYDDIASQSELILMFGGTPIRNAQVNSGGIARHDTLAQLQKCVENGIEIISISPLKSDVDVKASWLALRPNSDTALLLSICHYLLVRKHVDYSFLNTYTTGFAAFADYLLGKSDGIVKNIDWAANITDIEAATIKSLCEKVAAKKTFIMVAWALQRADHGEYVYWAAIALAAMLGTIGTKGLGFGFGYASAGNIGMKGPLVSLPSFPQGDNPIKDAIPVARIADMLLNPCKTYHFNGQTKIYPDIKLVYWAGGNPFHHHQDLNRLRDAWQKPDTIIAHEHWWNAHARHADIVFPAVTFLERNDIAASGRDSFLTYSKAQFEAPSGITTDHEILRQLSQRLGAEQEFTQGRSEEQWLEWLYDETRIAFKAQNVELPDYENFKNIGYLDLPQKNQPTLLSEFRSNPQDHPLRTPSGVIELFSNKIASFNYADSPPHPAWLEPQEWLGAKMAVRFPLHLLSCQPHDKLHSQWDHAKICRDTKKHGRQPIVLNIDDAKSRHISQNDIVKVFNERGACLASAVLSENIKQGVVQLPTGAWFDPWQDEQGNWIELNGNPNVLTADHGTSTLTQAPSANSCLVEIEKFHGFAPKPSIYQPPIFSKSNASWKDNDNADKV
ncbi:molybdopterin-dependent oxidoreductase (plasmid) [Bartonella sp. HY329]|uniref:molybdopterin-dependent oxidoreductase n=1 Tax=unclassified Bartonella TaxID=2645622 RepID=UPI0021C67EA5|nr:MULTISPECIES: molybdopterin-dependent oxidoreductase [unclassified Bartonella]UXM96485.1 molybdopterin-dependent oxidoreductase [Bartonella sp. HY329]UXN10808.1 molybdopterin-dependent oxidoreductase [Bartonella sp. HY328]